ncbi:folylpolyglutamate synthase 1 isoform 1-T2 [Cochliomyia hominivorax]
MLTTMNIVKTFIRRVYVLKANGCGVDCDQFPVNVCKMLQTFEECVFQKINKKYISTSVDYNKKSVEAKSYPINNNNNVTLSENHYNKNNLNQQTDECVEYEEAVKALNCLQSNAESIRSSLQQRKRLNSLEDTKQYLIRSGLTIKDLEKLSYIHVSGTKGKGSTCALVDSILRSYGVKTGFYSSPHLVSLTERIRINGQPISKQKFTQYFWPVYNQLKSAQESENDMPAYFKFLTILAFHIYLAEKIDAVIMEVGIGGELDSTNIIPNTKTVGITSLGLEHTQLLGNSLKEIAWQKAGIIKPFSTVYTSVTQEECWQVIKARAKEKQAKVYRVPEFESYFQDPKLVEVKKQLNNVTVLNGSLALQLAYDWLRRNCNGFHKDYEINEPRLTEQAIKGILNCNWPGRCQRVKFFNFNIHLDGAHTVESMQVCGKWFKEVTAFCEIPKILIFNTTGDRDSKKLLTILRSFSTFDLVCFVPNIASLGTNKNHDNNSILYSHVEQLKRAQMHATNWQSLCQEANETNNAKVFPTITHSFQHIREVYNKTEELNILVTGSIHLIGATILSLNDLCKELNEQYS